MADDNDAVGIDDDRLPETELVDGLDHGGNRIVADSRILFVRRWAFDRCFARGRSSDHPVTGSLKTTQQTACVLALPMQGEIRKGLVGGWLFRWLDGWDERYSPESSEPSVVCERNVSRSSTSKRPSMFLPRPSPPSPQ